MYECMYVRMYTLNYLIWLQEDIVWVVNRLIVLSRDLLIIARSLLNQIKLDLIYMYIYIDRKFMINLVGIC